MGKPSNISTWTCEALHISSGDRIDGAYHNNGDRIGCFFSGTDHHIINGHNDINFLLDKLVHESGNPIQPALCIAAFDQHVFALNVAEIAQPLPEYAKQG